jgi:hypothetical protein
MEVKIMNKKFFTILLTLTIALATIVNADGTTINDINKSSSYAKSSILYLADQNIISGDEKGNFNPQKSVTRAEMVALMAKAMNLNTSNTPEKATFKDVPTNNWAAKYVEAAYKEGIITGISATEFKPNDIITREQMAVIFVRALKLVEQDKDIELININSFSDKARISTWSQKEVEIAVEAGLMNGVSEKSFEPKTAANKEQSAVVIERLLKNKDKIIAMFKIQSVDEKTVKLIMNNENIILDKKAMVQDNNVFVPVEFLSKFLSDPNEAATSETDKVFWFTPAPEYADTTVKYLWLQVGNKLAYTNLGGDPLTVPEVPIESHVPMDIAPIQIDGINYVSAKDIFRILDIGYTFNFETNTMNISNNKIKVDPNLYLALKQLTQYYDFVGEIKSQGQLKFTDYNTNETAALSYDMSDKQSDSYTVSSYVKETVEANGQAPQVTEYQSVISGNKYYEKDFTDNKWVIYDTNQKRTYSYTPFFDPIFENEEIKNTEMNEILFENLNRIDVKKAGTVLISGIPATKYVMEFDMNTIKNTMSEEDYVIVKEMAASAFQGKLSYRYEFYVANNKVIKQTFEFQGDTIDSETGSTVNYYSNSIIYYKNIGKKPSISLPPASEIKPAQN